VSDVGTEILDRWLGALEARHRADLSFAEIRRGLQALSSLYVERRDRAPLADAFRGAGKRAAYALFYGPLHFLVVGRIVREIGAASPPPERILDLGCGTGAAGAAWAIEAKGTPEVLGVDQAEWAVVETALALRALRVGGRARRTDVDRARLPGANGAVVAAYTLNEVGAPARDRLLDRLLDAAAGGTRVLVIEPVARRVAPWWGEWSAAFTSAGGRDDTWRFRLELPERLRLLDRAAGLDHRETAARSLWMGGAA
jgi:SAM-dependent methyltransferase